MSAQSGVKASLRSALAIETVEPAPTPVAVGVAVLALLTLGPLRLRPPVDIHQARPEQQDQSGMGKALLALAAGGLDDAKPRPGRQFRERARRRGRALHDVVETAPPTSRSPKDSHARWSPGTHGRKPSDQLRNRGSRCRHLSYPRSPWPQRRYRASVSPGTACRAPARWDHPSARDMGPVCGVVNVGVVMIVGVPARGQGAGC